MRRFLPALLAFACASGTFDGRIYRGDGLSFRTGPVPGSWRRIEMDQALIAFRDDGAAATIAINGRCGEDGDDVPLRALTAHLFLEFTDRREQSQALVSLDGREALRTEMVAKLDGVPMRFTVYVLKKNGCVYDFLYIAESGGPRSSQADFEGFVRGFATLRAGS
jgi:hypothetical protein